MRMDKIRRLILKEIFLIILAIIFIIFAISIPRFLEKIPKLVDVDTILTIFIFILLSRSFEESRLFQKVAIDIIERCRNNRKLVIILLTILSSISAMFIMNDCTVIMFTPLSLYIADILEIDKSIIVIDIAASANIGSTLTPIGNPQNIIIWRFSKISFLKFCIITAPLVLLLSISLLSIIYIYLRSQRNVHARGFYKFEVDIDKKLATISTILLIFDIVMIEFNKIIIATLVTVIAILLANYRVFKKVDYLLILLFILMFADFGQIALILRKCNIFTNIIRSPTWTYLFSIIISQFVSNVPSTILLINQAIKDRTLIALLYGVNVAGLGTVIGSLANFIAVRLSGISMKSYHKYATPIFLISIILGLILLLYSI